MSRHLLRIAPLVLALTACQDITRPRDPTPEGLTRLSPATSSLVSGEFVYVANGSSNTVSVIETAGNTVVATVPVGSIPFGVAVTPNGAFVYVTNQGSGSVSVIETAGNTVVATIAGVGTGPRGIAVTPDGTQVYVTNQTGGTVHVIETAGNTVVATIDVDTEGVGFPGSDPFGVAFTPDGAFAYIANGANLSNSMAIIETATFNVVDAITGFMALGPVGDGRLFDVAMAPDGAHAWVTNRSEDLVSVIATASNTIVGDVTVGDLPLYLAFTPDGAFVYVTNILSSNVSVVATASNTVVATVPIGGSQIWGVTVAPDGNHVYVVARDIQAVKVIATATNTVVATIGVGAQPFGIAITPLLTSPSPEQQIEFLKGDVQSLVSDGLLARGKAKGLTKKLDGALKKLNKGRVRQAIKKLRSFIKRVRRLVDKSKLPAAEGQALIDSTQGIIDQLST